MHQLQSIHKEIKLQETPSQITLTFNAQQVEIAKIISLTMQFYHVMDIKILDIEIEDIVKKIYRGGVIESY